MLGKVCKSGMIKDILCIHVYALECVVSLSWMMSCFDVSIYKYVAWDIYEKKVDNGHR